MVKIIYENEFKELNELFFKTCHQIMSFLNKYEYECGSNPDSLYKKTRGNSYNYIPLRLDEFIHQVNFAYKYLCQKSNIFVKFLDAGCGIGDKLLFNPFRISLGLELCNDTIKKGKQLGFINGRIS